MQVLSWLNIYTLVETEIRKSQILEFSNYKLYLVLALSLW